MKNAWVPAALVSAVLLTGCTSGPATDPSPASTVSAPSSPAPTPAPSSPGATPGVLRKVTSANLLTAKDIPKLPLGGTVKPYDEHARPVGRISVCEQDLTQLHATSMVHASFRQQADGEPKTPLRGRPTVYVLALQFASPSAAVQAQQTWKSWLDTCRDELPAGTGFESVDVGFPWQAVKVAGGTAEVSEIGYTPTGSDSEAIYWESTGLTVVQDRMMVTVHLFHAIESLYNMDTGNDEGGSPHPQLKMTKAAAVRLTR